MVCRNLRVRVLRRRAIFQVLPNVGRAAIVATFRFDPRLNFYRVVWSGKSRVLEIRSIRVIRVQSFLIIYLFFKSPINRLSVQL